MNRVLLLIIIASSAATYCQEWLQDTCVLDGPVKSIDFVSREYFDEDDKPMITSHFDQYNRQGFLVNSDRIWTGFLAGRNGIIRKFDETGTQCLREYRSFDEDTSRYYDMVFDKSGRLQKQILIIDGDHWSTFNYRYDENDRIIEEFVVIQKTLDTSHRFFEYDDFGRMTKDTEIRERSNSTFIWKYNEAGQLAEEMLFDSSWTKKSYYEENEDGEMILVKKEDHSRNVSTIESYIKKYDYNEENLPIREYKTAIDGTPQWETLKTYDENQNLAQKISLNLKEDKRYVRTYEFVFDDYDNWTSRIVHLDGNLEQKETRIIEYY